MHFSESYSSTDQFKVACAVVQDSMKSHSFVNFDQLYISHELEIVMVPASEI